MALALLALPGCGLGGPERSKESFCAELRSGAAKLDEQTAAAPKDGSSQFALLLRNMGDFNRLLHRLEERAPNEIRSDIEQVVKLFDDQADRSSEAAKNPFGALAAGLLGSILNASSVEAIDEYAEANCGRTLFGSLGQSGGTGTTVPPCPNLSSQALGRDASLADFQRRLKEAREANIASAAALQDAVAGLKPQPATALEALGRLRFVGKDPEALLKTVGEETQSKCRRAVGTSELRDALASAGPRPQGEGLVLGNYAGTCAPVSATSPSFVAPSTVVLACDGKLALLALDSKLVTPVSATIGVKYDPYAGGLVQDRYFWWQTEAVPASGLTPATKKHSLLSVSLDGSNRQTVATFEGPESSAEFAGSYQDRFLSHERVSGRDGGRNDAVVRDKSGKEIARIALTSTPDSADRVFDSVFSVGSTLIDVRTGTTAEAKLSSSDGHDACLQTAVGTTKTGAVTVRATRGGIKIAPFPVRSPVAVLSDAGVLTKPGNFALIRADGSTAWTIESSVVRGWVVFGGALFVRNAAGQVFPIDSGTGKEGSAPPVLLAAATTLLNQGTVLIDHDAGVGVMVETGNVAIGPVAMEACKSR